MKAGIIFLNNLNFDDIFRISWEKHILLKGYGYGAIWISDIINPILEGVRGSFITQLDK
jgi:hypothetical protein